MPNLIVEKGRDRGAQVEVKAGTTVVIGRDPSCQLAITDPAASRRHFEIKSVNGGWQLNDLGSKNATFLDENRVTDPVPLEYGARIQVGETIFSFFDEEKSAGGGTGLSGKELGGYKILERLGRGGMGTVFKARQISLNRVVALKILSSKFSKDATFVKNFVSEARAAGQLNHPNVVQVFDVANAGGLHMFSMELMEGGSVQDLLASKPHSRMEWTEALPMLMDAARGLVFAEKRGIVHRDIKPDNLMLTSEQRVKIADLGLAKHDDDESDGKIFGTPHFISPEQALGKEVTAAADIYSLGATMYRILAGKTPFHGDTVKEILRHQIHDQPEPLTSIVEDFPPDLAQILDKMMQKNVEDRYRTAAKLLEDFEAFELAHQIELAGGVRKNYKPALIGAGVVVVALGAALAWKLSQPKEIETVTIKEDPEVIIKGPKPKTAAELQAELDLSFRAAFYEIKDKDRGDITLEKKNDWYELADKYQALEKKYGTATKIGDALGRATEIRNKIKALETYEIEVVEKAKDWWKNLKAKIDAELKDEKWGDALNSANLALADAAALRHMEHVPDGKGTLEGVEADVLKRVEASFDAAVKAGNTQMMAGDYAEGIRAVRDWARTTRTNSGGHEGVEQFVISAQDWAEEQSANVQQDLEDRLKADRIVFVEACRQVATVDAKPPDTGGPVFEYRFGAAADQLQSATGTLKTWLYQRRAAARVEELRALQTDWDAFTTAFASGALFGAKDAIPDHPGTGKGSRAYIDLRKKGTSDEYFLVIRVGRVGSSSRSYKWADRTPQELATSFVLPAIEKLDAKLALGMARVFVTIGHGSAAAACAERAKTQGETLDAGLTSELGAIEAFQKILDVEDATAPGKIENQVNAWRAQHFTTDTSVVFDGRPAEATPHPFTESEIQAYKDTFGKDPDETPPNPPPENGGK